MSEKQIIKRECDPTNCRSFSRSWVERRAKQAYAIALEKDSRTAMEYARGLFKLLEEKKNEYQECDWQSDKVTHDCAYMMGFDAPMDETQARFQGAGSSAGDTRVEAWQAPQATFETYTPEEITYVEDDFTLWLPGYLQRRLDGKKSATKKEKETGEYKLPDLDWHLSQYAQLIEGYIPGYDFIELMEQWRDFTATVQQEAGIYQGLRVTDEDREHYVGDWLTAFNRLFSDQALNMNKKRHIPQIIWAYRSFVREHLSALVCDNFESIVQSDPDNSKKLVRSNLFKERIEKIKSEMSYNEQKRFKKIISSAY